MFYLVAIAFFPILLLLIIPFGLIFMRLSGLAGTQDEIGVALAPPAGLALLLIFVGLAIRAGLPADMLGPIVVLLAIAAWARLRSWGLLSSIFARLWPLVLAAGVAYLVLIAPLLLAGDFGVLGHNVNNDPVFHSILPEYLATYGYDLPSDPQDGFSQAAVDKLVNQGYPDGWHQALLFAGTLFRMRAWQLFNFTEALFMALMVPVVFAWLRAGGLNRSWSISGGVVAAVGYLQLSYVFQGFAPQVAVTPFIYASLLVFYKVIAEGKFGFAGPAALFMQAGLAVYSFTILLWLGVFIAVIAGRQILRRDRTGLAARLTWGGAALAAGFIINPFTLAGIWRSLRAVLEFSNADGLGNLISKSVPIVPVLNVWFAADHRVVPLPAWHQAGYLAGAIILALFLAGVVRRPGRGLWLAGFAAMSVPIILLKVGAGPYYFAKALQTGAPMVVIGAVGALAAIGAKGSNRGLQAGLTVALLLAVGVSDMAVVRATPMTPSARFVELDLINDDFGGAPGLTLFVETDEDWGKYLLSKMKVASPLARSYGGRSPQPRENVGPESIDDLDRFQGVLSRNYGTIVIDRRQDISLAPPPFVLKRAGRFYNVYQKERSLPTAAAHLPGEDFAAGGAGSFLEIEPGGERSIPATAAFQKVLVSAYLFPHVIVEPEQWEPATPDWSFAELSGRPILRLADSPGRASTAINVFESGPYEIFLTGDLGSRLTLSIDGRALDGRFDPSITAPAEAAGFISGPGIASGGGRMVLASSERGSGSYVGTALLANLKSSPGDMAAVGVLGSRMKSVRLGRMPAVYEFSLEGDSNAVLRVKNKSSFPLRLDWVELVGAGQDRLALLRYNNENKLAFGSIERLLSR